ncbi:hypothetical protein, partial [Nocardia alni]|uniref:hypothetical protein n=1 Tax=Nocardia alni TaxID=2815723 RepID=UPI001C21B237
MNGRTLARVAAAAACAGIGAATVFGAAAADPAPRPTPVDTAITQLNKAAGKDKAAEAGVNKLAKTADLLTATKLDYIAGAFQPMWFSSPTFGCPGNPVSLTMSSGEAGSNQISNGLAGGYGTVRFQAAPAAVGYPIRSGLNIAWLNTANGRSGITPMDDKTQYNLPALSKTIHTGPGTVIASLWGSVTYPGGTCVMAPTVGAISVYNS